ncbi:MAG TPA: hypothetical protein VFE51_28135 [Verrucomicrobiae bacterium]|nr:hypothetical protein [Verrucomicrobiae bacterium]
MKGRNLRLPVSRRSVPLLLLAALLYLGSSVRAAIPLRLDDPTAFFTNIAARLLKSELNLDLNKLQVYPTNYYTPSVHRLLQVAANLYDCTTNRALGLTPEYPYCPSVFRPLFRRLDDGTNTMVVIAGYREVVDTQMADPRLAPMVYDLTQPNAPLLAFLPYGTVSPGGLEKNEPMVSGIPLVIGAKKGFPNFNEFSMETQVLVERLLEFRRPPGDPYVSPVNETNQMYVVGISNRFGLEAWNSYQTAYPRKLRLVTGIYMTAVMTNEAGVILSNTVITGASIDSDTNTWPGWTTPSSAPASMVLPFGNTNQFAFLPNSSYIDNAPWFTPLTHVFTRNAGFYIPHWWFNLSTRVLFILVDTDANRIVDYVNLNHAESTVDITSLLASDASANPGDYGNPGNEWLTNRVGASGSSDAATFGIINQIQVGLHGTTDWLNFVQDPYAGLDMQKAVDSFRNNFGLSPVYNAGMTFYRSNVFYAPFDPARSLFVHTSWQANDPLVHYTVGDLVTALDFDFTNEVNLIPLGLHSLGVINSRYRPWPGNPMNSDPTTDGQISVKDPGISRPEDWNFPANQSLSLDWVGRVHRGTPWQTIFLKSTNFLLQPQGLQNWAYWSGNPSISDAQLTAPINDWHLVSLLNNFFNTNDVGTLGSPNLATAQTWEALLDGITIFTNSGSGHFTPTVISSNSLQAEIIAGGLLSARASEPSRIFRNVGDILATPELSGFSPFLGFGSSSLTDEALEAIPAQLISRLRPDAIVTPTQASEPGQLQFTGMDGASYVVQSSFDLMNWARVTTNTPENGVFNFKLPSSAGSQFYRSSLLP